MKIKGKDRKSESKQLKYSKLLPSHQKALLRCRDYLQQTLKVDIFKSLQFKDRSSSFGKFSSLSSSTVTTPLLSVSSNLDLQHHSPQPDFKSERISLFLDQLENSDEKTFANFMEILKDHNRNVHKILDKAIKLYELEEINDEEFDEEFCEYGKSSTLPGYAVLEILKQQKCRSSLQSIEEDNLLQNIDENNIHLFNEIIDDKDYHVNCFVVASKSEHRDKPWIKHDNSRKKYSDASADPNINNPYMAVTTKDIVFQTVTVSSLPFNVKKPPENIEKVFIIDEQCAYSPSIAENNDRFPRKNEFRERYCSRKYSCKNKYHVFTTNSNNPPPLPPKPESLTPTPKVKIRERTRCNINRNFIDKNENNSTRDNMQNKFDCNAINDLNDVAPPIPVRKKIDHFSKPPPAIPVSFNTRESFKSSGSSRLWSNDSTLPSADGKVSYGTDDDDSDDGDDDNDDNISLNYIIEPEDTDEMEEPYEPIATESSKPILPPKMSTNDQTNCKNKKDDDYNKETFVNVDDGGNVISSTNPDHDHVGSNFSNIADHCKNANDNDLYSTESDLNHHKNINDDNNYIDVVDNNNKIPNTTTSNSDEIAKINDTIQLNEADVSVNDEIIQKLSNDNTLMTTTITTTSSTTAETTIAAATTATIIDAATSVPATTPDYDKVDVVHEKTSEGSMETLTTTTVSVSRSSSGVSATVSDQMTTRDSGVDSTISHSLHDSPFCVSDQVEDLDAIIPNSHTYNCNDKLGSMGRNNESSYYEDIDSMNPSGSVYMSHYLDPRSEMPNFTENLKINSDQKVVTCGTLLLCETVAALSVHPNESQEQLRQQTPTGICTEQFAKRFENSVLGYDREGFAYYVPTDCIHKYGDPKNEPWFFPRAISVKEASIFLNQEKQKGCFVVYSPPNSEEIPYYLSVCENNCGDIYHYPIIENARGDIAIEGADHSFLNVCELINFYRKNRENLVTRLRRPLKESKMPIIPGHHYPANFEISKKSIRLFGEIILKDKFGITCKGNYGHQTVLVKALQHHLVVENEDDFLEEALILMKLNHENIAKLLGVCFKNRPYYLVVENLNCGTLKDCLRNNIVPSGRPDIQIDICLQIVTAMVYLEKKHFVLHRNIRTKHFLISSDYLVKLFNFDRAKFVDDDCYRACTSDDIPVRWSAPEVFIQSLYSTKSDVWSTGIVMWEIFSQGQNPYNHLNEQEVVLYVSEKGKLDKPVECDARMFSIINQCLKYKPEMRPTFHELENKIKGQSCIYYESHPFFKTSADTPSSSNNRLESYLLENTNNNIALPIKATKGYSHSGPTTPNVLTPALTTRNNTLQTSSNNDSKMDDIMRSLNSRSKQNNSRNVYILNSRHNSNLDTSSASLPCTQLIDGESRDNKIRKSLRKLLKKGNLNIKNSE